MYQSAVWTRLDPPLRAGAVCLESLVGPLKVTAVTWRRADP